MKRTLVARGAIAATAVALAGLTACKSITNSVEVAEITGFWVASDALFAEVGNLNNREDLVRLGWTVTTEIEADGSYATVLIEPVEPGLVRDSLVGVLTIENRKDVKITRGDNTVGEGEVFLEGDQVAFLFDETAGFTWDVRGNGTRVPVTLQLVMDRQ